MELQSRITVSPAMARLTRKGKMPSKTLKRPRNPAVRCDELLECVAERLRRRARHIYAARAMTTEESAVRRAMVVICNELADILTEEITKHSNVGVERPR